MAALTAAGVTIEEVWSEGNTNGRKFRSVRATLVLSSQGGLTNNIPAALFGLRKIYRANAFRDANSVHYEAYPSFDGSLLVFCTDATSGSPADQTVTVRGIVTGTQL